MRNGPNHARFLVSLLLAAAAALPGAGCSRAPAGPAGSASVPVRAAAATLEDVPIELRAIGTVEAYSTVEIRAQVGGVLEKAHFREGQEVRRGDLLFTLDARPYRAALESAEARLSRDSVQLDTARQDVERYGELVGEEYVTKEEFDRIRTNAASLEAAVRADQAAIDNAAVELEHCTITAPIGGRTGQLMVHEGNLVKANSDAPLLTIKKIAPIYVAFSVPERSLPEIRARRAQGELRVGAMMAGAGGAERTGELSFIDNAVDRSTGTVLLKATFPNEDAALWPGQFVDVSLRLSTRTGAVVVPAQAIQTGQNGLFVFVVKADSTVESRPVVPGQGAGGATVIESGVSAGEVVVTDGQLRLVPGTRVSILEDSGAGAADAEPAGEGAP